MLQRPSAHAAPEQHPVGPQAKRPKPAPAVVGAVPRPKRAPIPDDVISDVGALSALAGQDRAFLDPSQMPGRSHKRLAPGMFLVIFPLPQCSPVEALGVSATRVVKCCGEWNAWSLLAVGSSGYACNM